MLGGAGGRCAAASVVLFNLGHRKAVRLPLGWAAMVRGMSLFKDSANDRAMRRG
jgi:hypothetical protein